MIEDTDNATIRKNAIKNILIKLHEGKSIDEVKSEFAEAFQDLDETEIVQAEQTLVDEGLPIEEIQNLCDVHTAVFRDSLNKHTELKTPSGHPINTFQRENLAVGSVLMKLRLTLETLKNHPFSENIEAALKALRYLMLFEKHYLRKENLLFPYLEKYQFSGPSSVMWGIHDEIRSSWKKMAGILESNNLENHEDLISQIFSIYITTETSIKEMIYKEEKILFPAAWARLDRSDWASIRRQEERVGYCYITPIQPEDIILDGSQKSYNTLSLNQGEKQSETLFNLHTGQLNEIQLDIMLRTLPIDITYVDENDMVCYFSESKERIFERDAAIIGRKVQNCHPPKSMAIVQRILDDFRKGKRDIAEFWVQLSGKFIHIRYYPLTDDNGTYLGCIEVTQDITSIRSLQGERRLLSEAA